MSTISWLKDETGRAGETWNPIRARAKKTGKVGWYCEPVHAGCKYCYAGAQNKAAARGGTGLPYTPGHRGDVEIFLDEKTLFAPHSWKTPRRIFPCSMTDLFGPWVPDGWIVRILEVIYSTPWHTYIVLTKRPDRMRAFMTRWGDLTGEDFDPKLVRGPEATREAHPSPRGQLFAAYLEALLESAGGKVPKGAAFPTFDWVGGMINWTAFPHNMIAGPSCSTQEDADAFIPEVLATPLARRIVSLEPLLGRVDLNSTKGGTLWIGGQRGCGGTHRGNGSSDCPREPHHHHDERCARGLDGVIVGGLSGPHPTDIDAIRAVVAQCRGAGVPVFVKQLGRSCRMSREDAVQAVALGAGWRADSAGAPAGIVHFRNRKGEDPVEWPADLRVREFPSTLGAI